MAIYHYHAQVIGRTQGHSALAAAAYRAGVSLSDFDYSKRKASVDFAQIYAPANAPEWAQDRAQLWQAVEDSEKRKDAQLCREINLALPVELTPEERQALAIEFVQKEFVSRGMVADLAIHHQNSQNPHAHIMLTTRHIDQNGFGQKAREWNGRDVLQASRQAWADIANVYLDRAGHDVRIDHRTLEAQGIDRPPQIHHGKAVTAMIRRGEQTRVEELEAIRQEKFMLAKQGSELTKQTTVLAKEEKLLEVQEELEAQAELTRQERIKSGAELADQIEAKGLKLYKARRDRILANEELTNAIQKANEITYSINEHNQNVDKLGFWEGFKNTFKIYSKGKQLDKEYETAIKKVDEAKKIFEEKQNAETKLTTELQELEKAFAVTPLGKEQKRQEDLKREQERQKAELEKKEQEEKLQREIQERKKREAQRQKESPTLKKGMGFSR